MSARAPGMAWAELLRGLAQPAQDVWVTDLCLDSRQVRAGALFVARRGGSTHGLDFAPAAVAAGAVAILHDGAREISEDPGVPCLAFPQLDQHLATLADRFWPQVKRMDLVAVTGTNGKTSVAWLLAQALDGAMLGTLGSGRPGEEQPGTHTTPDVFSVYRELARLSEQGHAPVVLEASSHALDQGRLAGLSFRCTIFTGLGHDHLDYHRDLESYFEAKVRLFTEFDSQRQIINLDNARGRELFARLDSVPDRIGYTLGEQDQARARMVAQRIDLNGLQAELRTDAASIELHSTLLGRINLHNLAIVALELQARGLSPEAITARVAGLRPVPGRMQALRGARGQIAVIDYAHSPDALENVLFSLRELGAERIWCVFGCGGERDVAKRPRMGRIAESLADEVILTDDNPRGEDGLVIIRAIQSGQRRPERSRVIRDREAAILAALSECGAGDLVLVAGKGHETEQVIGDQRLPFSDAAVVRRCLEEAA
ncbi:MAG: UDP-N-acetylmuramoyl-L-alanyl-D-glutamate--2,6-diaminopimelate ligase [Wenzhouxiangella sp.]